MKDFKLLKVVSSNFKLCGDNFTISLVPIANKTEEDKEYELNNIYENLYTFTTIGIVEKNASGKTTAVELIDVVYEILSNFRIRNRVNLFKTSKNTKLTIYFYYDNYLYKYLTELNYSTISNTENFDNEKIF